MRTAVNPSQWTNAYDWYFTGNKRDQMRLEESERGSIVDTTFFGGSFTSEAYHSHMVMTKALKNLQRSQYELNKDEIIKRNEEQNKTRRKRIEGFLRAANINIQSDPKPVATPVAAAEEGQPAPEAPKDTNAEAPAKEAANEDESKKIVKKYTAKQRVHEDDHNDDVDSQYDFDQTAFGRLDNNLFLPNRLSIGTLMKPNFSAWLQTLLATTYAPDDIVTRNVPLSTRNVDSLHRLLDLALDLQNPYLLAIMEKACGLFGQSLSLQLREKYKHFKEEVLLRDPGTL